MEFDPHAPFVAQDGLEYDSAFAYLAGKPKDTYRNNRITFFRSQGRSEEAVKAWIAGYDAPPEELNRRAEELTSCPFIDIFDEEDLRIANANESLVAAYGPAALYAPTEPLQPRR